MWDKQIQKYSNDGELFASQQGWQVEGLQWFAAKTTEHAVICEFTNGLSVYTAYLHSLNFDSKVLYDCP
ncbi:hypothetical protein RS130_19935 [Paraglaciecola aquimarina]|uniref:Uncharacterized protein n=1 Tax=Paraglaciecola aquimarina TaxID=1235557 RepID=A0ABU3T0W0_9ALTE|nr:hypothetical protein [Paraglaciecola aquimarina]MDU0355853.1 hypothetical protein [Paraglaciecola aquimarina]